MWDGLEILRAHWTVGGVFRLTHAIALAVVGSGPRHLAHVSRYRESTPGKPPAMSSRARSPHGAEAEAAIPGSTR
jgi:hypothetical protein